jgi:hypothetical protein
VSGRAAAVLIAMLLPLTLAASDPRDDAVACRGTHGLGDPPDLVAAVGRADEEGSSAVWTLTFAEPLHVPDPVDPPFRVDVVIRDPKVPAVSYGDYRDFDRIVRYDATSAHPYLELLFITEGGHTLFDPPRIDGDTMTIEMPGRLLLGADEFARSAMERLRWTVIVRDGGRCDLLGDGTTSQRLTSAPAASSPASLPTDQVRDTEGLFRGRQATAAVIIAVLVLVSILVAAIVLRRRR